MKSILVLTLSFLLSGCVVDSYYSDPNYGYNYTETSTYIPAGSTMIYTERVVTPQFYYRETYPVYVQPRYYHNPNYRDWDDRRPRHWNNNNRHDHKNKSRNDFNNEHPRKHN